MEVSDHDRLVRLETHMSAFSKQLETIAGDVHRLGLDQHAASSESTRVMHEHQIELAAQRRDDQEMHRNALYDLQEEARRARLHDQQEFKEAMDKMLMQIQAVTTTTSNMASQFIKREDILWLRQGLSQFLGLAVVSLLSWWLSKH